MSRRDAARRPARSRVGQGSTDGHGRGRWLALGGGLAIVLVLAGTAALWLGRPGTPDVTPEEGSAPLAAPTTTGAFPIVAYQGADVLGAQELDFGTLLGTGTPVVLNFWAGQCPPCRAEMPAFQRVHDAYGGRFLLVGVDIGPFVGLGSHRSATDLLTELGITYPAAYAVDAAAVEGHRIVGMPTTIFYDGAGREVGRNTGLLTEDALSSRVRELVARAG